MTALLSGRTAAVTGGARGIGLSIATRLAAHGAQVALIDLDEQQTQAAARDVQESTGSRALGLAADVTDAVLATLRPGDAVLGEEEGGSVEVPSGVRWVIDPIDGTVNFLYGIPAYSVSVGAQVNGRTVAGAVVDVVRGTTYSATRGEGAYSDDGSGPVRLRTNPIDKVGLALVATGFGYGSARRRVQGELISALLPHIRDVRRIGSAALDLCMVASGAVDAHFEHGLSPWDWAAGSLIAEEAGAVVTIPDATSRSAAGNVTLAMAPGIADELGELLARLGALEPIPD